MDVMGKAVEQGACGSLYKVAARSLFECWIKKTLDDNERPHHGRMPATLKPAIARACSMWLGLGT
jgi:hypothetical protein